ncbi:hypothetical protein BDZ88DRAFT_411968 [Geranomyces variabilis]|nr:hypothetical protein BDZ88DRAFT_411968 [Geranomyces variabilis]
MFSRRMNYPLLNRLSKLLSLIFGVRSGASCRMIRSALSSISHMRWHANPRNMSAHTAHSLACGKQRNFRPSSRLSLFAPAMFNRMSPLTRKRSSML